jgi:dCTP deaminase
MAALSDGTIRRLLEEGRVKIEPFDDAMIQPASVDLKLGPSFRVFHNFRVESIDLADPPQGLTEHVEIAEDEPFVVHPGEFVLGRTEETVELPDDVVARVEGKSSLGRLGLIVHATAGFVDPGFKGTLTLEITNLTRVPIKLWAGKPIAQLSFMSLDRPAERPYGHPDLGSHYFGQVDATESRYEGGPAGTASD